MATVVKNFRIKSGLIVEGTTGTINGQNILTETGGDNYILNLVGGATLVKSVDTNVFNVDGAGNLTVNANTFDSYGSASAAQSAAATDATNKANAALASAQTYADSAASNAVSTAASDATTKANNAQSNAENYADGLISTEVTNRNNAISSAISDEVSDRNSAISTAITNEVSARNSAIATAKSEAISDANAYTDQEVAALVSGAPALLDTLNELAAAIADNPNYATDVANLVATKADTTYVNQEISDLNTAAQGYASAAQTAAEATASTDATNKANAAQTAAATYTDNAVNGLTSGDTQFTEVSIGWMTDQIASYAYANTGSEVVAYSWNHNKGASAKFLVRMRNGANSQVSEILLTRDNSNNIAISEYGIVTTNGILGDITAGMNGNNIELKVSPTHNDGTEIIVSGTLMSYGD